MNFAVIKDFGFILGKFIEKYNIPLGADTPEGYYKFDVLQVPPDRYIVNMGTSKLVNYAHKNNIAVCYWTINDEEKMEFLQSIGADGIITDVPDVACKVLKTDK